MKVIIIGGGIMGCMNALRLAEGGADVLVLERSVPGAEASSVAAGILAPAFEGAHVPRPKEVIPYGVRSRELHAELANQLRQDHNNDVGYHRCGVLSVAFEGEEDSYLGQHQTLIDGLSLDNARVERIDGEEARRRESSLSPAVSSALDFLDAAQCDPRRLLAALAIAAERAGVVFRTGAAVRSVIASDTRVASPSERPMVLVGNESLEADHVLAAAGSWTGLIPGLGQNAEVVHPVRGQIVMTKTRPPLFRRIIFGAGGYLVPRPDGRVFCGSTEEQVGFRREVTFQGLQTILAMATKLAPRLAMAPVIEHRCNFRPGTADDLPLVGPSGLHRVWLASGHYRNGILQAPITADILSRAIFGKEPSPFAALVDPRRLQTDEKR